jgi:proteasome lid subunit RPN8/RPN11
MFPVYLAKKETKFPAKGTYYVLAANGAFIRKQSKLFDGLVKVPMSEVPGIMEVSHCIKTESGPVFLKKEKIEKSSKSNWWYQNQKSDELESFEIVDPNSDDEPDDALVSVEPYISMENLPKLPGELLYKTLLFHRAVYRKHRAEGMIMIAYNEQRREYKFFCPVQEVSGAHIDYDPDYDSMVPDYLNQVRTGWRFVGTIHSHPNFNAYHSGVDTGDEAEFDGVHLTFGHVCEKSFSIASSLVLNDYREEVMPENVCVGLKHIGDENANNSDFISSSSQNFYQIDIPNFKELKKQFEKEIEEEWMPLVSSPKITYGFGGSKSKKNSNYLTSSDFDDYDEYTEDFEDEEYLKNLKSSLQEETDLFKQDDEDIWPDDEFID